MYHTTNLLPSQQLPELDSEAEAEATAEEFMRLSSFINRRISLPALVLSEETSQPSSLNTSNLDFSILVELRRTHQTRYAAEGVRTRDAIEADRPEESVRHKLMRELNALLRQEGSCAPGTGQDRKLRWLEPTQRGTGSTPESQPILVPTGNSANAAVVTQSRVKKVTSQRHLFLPVLTSVQALEYRRERLSRARVPLLNLLASARVSSLSPIVVGRFAWVLLDNQVVLAQGKYLLVIFSQTS